MLIYLVAFSIDVFNSVNNGIRIRTDYLCAEIVWRIKMDEQFLDTVYLFYRARGHHLLNATIAVTVLSMSYVSLYFSESSKDQVY